MSAIATTSPGPMQSRKFLAYLLADVGWIGLIAYALVMQSDGVLTITMALTRGFMGVGYVLGQAYVDRFVKIAEITAGRREVPPPTTP